MKNLILTAILGIGLGASAAQRPNILIIYTDDQGYGDMSLLNPESKFQTPNMDRLAKEGINFTHGHSAGTACTPSRYALLTGRYAWRTKLKAGVGSADEDSLIAEDRLTLQGMLRERYSGKDRDPGWIGGCYWMRQTRSTYRTVRE